MFTKDSLSLLYSEITLEYSGWRADMKGTVLIRKGLNVTARRSVDPYEEVRESQTWSLITWNRRVELIVSEFSMNNYWCDGGKH